ncbi:LysM peptidoglycan-binding domain-containing protein [Planctomicrobium sp. SH668]|uniref:LysM peptidoglycan-binding domain-containing protein n=1 Tax=Planctomicrobium sp. SH668 TaxID=3448126 RepID=UPI003F5C4704
MGKPHPQANRRDTVRSALESSFQIRQAQGRSASQLNPIEPMLELGPVASQSAAPKWGAAAIVVLLGGLGFALHDRMSDGDSSWTRWEKHELSGVVLGQSPESPATVVPARAETQGSTGAAPAWAKTPQKRPQVPVQGDIKLVSDMVETESADPFSAPARSAPAQVPENPQASPLPTQLPAQAGGRVVFSGDQAPAPGAVPQRQSVQTGHQAARQMGGATAQAGKGRVNAPPQHPLDLTLPVQEKPARSQGPHSGRPAQELRTVQQAGAVEEIPNLDFPEPQSLNQFESAQPVEFAPRDAVEMPSRSGFSSPTEHGLAPASLESDLPSLDEIPSLPGEQGEDQFNSGFESQPTPANPAVNEFNSAPMQNDLPAFSNQPSMPEPTYTQPQPTFTQPEPTFSQPGSPLSPVNQPIPQATPQRLMQPVQPVAVPQVTVKEDEIHKVEAGENYWTISRRYYGTARFFSALAEYNKHRIPAPDKMKPGMYVLVPDVEVLHQSYPQLTGGGPRDPNENAPPGFFVDAAGQPCYRVGKGETLSDIAQGTLGRSSRWVQIHNMNSDQLVDGRPLKIGTVLRLPADASQVVRAPTDSDIR